MSWKGPTARVTITLLPETNSPKYLIGGNYRPHIVIGPTSQWIALKEENIGIEHYLGIAFLDGPEAIHPGQTAEASFALMYFPKEPYSEVVSGATFTIREGSMIVGYGTVLNVDKRP